MAGEKELAKGATEQAQPDFARLLKVPAGDTLVRRIAGPDGQHPIGGVRMGRIYTVSVEFADSLCTGDGAEFEFVLPADQERIKQAAAKMAADQLAEKRKALDEEAAALAKKN